MLQDWKKYLLSVTFGLLLGSQVAGQSFYRSKATGNWNAVGTWESAPAAAGPWTNAVATPTFNDFAITIQAPHTVTINASVTIDEVTINLGAILAATGNITLTINNGAGVDLVNNGTFNDNVAAGGTIAFPGGSRWSISSGATLLKTSGSAGANWQNAYNTGIANIPANANWILRKITAANPVLNTTAPATGSVYPNLIIENNTGAAWTTPTFTGFIAFPTIKGNLDIGGGGSNVVSLLNDQTHLTSPTLVIGNVIIRAGNTLRNIGTGIEIRGNLTVDGFVTYDANDARILAFSGGNAQIVSGTGDINIFTMRMNKSAGDLTLNCALTVDNLLDLTWGKIISTPVNLITLIDVATVINANNNSFVDGPIRKNGDDAFIFPVGKLSDYQPIGMSSGGAATLPFWTEDFGFGCNQGNLASGYVSINGAWSQTLTGTNLPQANSWFVSATEAGVGTGNCGDGCISNGGLTNRTLHVGANDGFTPTDPGAAYNAGGLCPALFCVTTDKRLESPVINCIGKVNINISFNYIENGQGSNDNATLWYFDGAVWTNIYDMPKTSTCFGGQGQWTYTTVTLPASANNNPNVKVGFRWVNNDDGTGSDPSFAVDDIQMSVGSADAFTAEYFRGNPTLLFGPAMDPTLVTISNCEYWQLDHTLGVSNRLVTLDWDGNSCGITNINNLRVARWDIPGTIWRDEGNSMVTGTVLAGSIQSGNFMSTYGTFTLASIDPQPLPVELLAFDAAYNGNSVDLTWTTASEVNNDYFTIERSVDATEFIAIGTKKGAGNSSGLLNYYSEDLQPLKGFSYYRLRQTDFNGNSTVSKTKKISIQSVLEFTVYADPLQGQIVILSGGGLVMNGKIEIIDVLGKIHAATFVSGSDTFIIPSSGLARGTYFLRFRNSEWQSVKKFVY